MWKYRHPTEIVFGEGEAERLGSYMEELGLEKALLVTSPGFVRRGGAAEIAARSKGRIVAVASEVEPNPTVENAESCARIAREAGAECLVAVGGGSAMDCAKAVGVMLHDGCPAADLISGHQIRGMLPLVAVPTTAGTASEVSSGAVLSRKDLGVKKVFSSPALFPRLAVVDPVLTYSCPPDLTAASGFDVLAHALDALGNVKAQPFTDLFAVEAAALAFANLRAAYADGRNASARAAMARASVAAGMAFSQTGTTGSHACSYALTAKYGLPHGEACAFTLDFWFQANAAARPELEAFSRRIGFDGAGALCEEIRRLKEDLGLRTTLSAAGIPPEAAAELAAGAMAAANMKVNAAVLSLAEVEEMFRSRA
jgi:alcohol dehydrogenase